MHYATLVATGHWKAGEPRYDRASDRVRVGINDMLYKQENGWFDTVYCTHRDAWSSFNGEGVAMDIWAWLSQVGLRQ